MKTLDRPSLDTFFLGEKKKKKKNLGGSEAIRKTSNERLLMRSLFRHKHTRAHTYAEDSIIILKINDKKKNNWVYLFKEINVLF